MCARNLRPAEYRMSWLGLATATLKDSKRLAISRLFGEWSQYDSALRSQPRPGFGRETVEDCNSLSAVPLHPGVLRIKNLPDAQAMMCASKQTEGRV